MRKVLANIAAAGVNRQDPTSHHSGPLSRKRRISRAALSASLQLADQPGGEALQGREDIVQETYLRAASYQGREVRNPPALLIYIATNVAIDRERRRAARPLTFGVAEDEARSAHSQAEALELKQIIFALPPH